MDLRWGPYLTYLFELIHSALNSEKKFKFSKQLLPNETFGIWIENQSQQIFLKDFEKFDFIANCTRAL